MVVPMYEFSGKTFFTLYSIHCLIAFTFWDIGQYQKQPSRGVFKKRCSENMQQIYRRTPMPKCDLQSNFIESALRHGCSPVNLMHIFRTFFPKNTSGRLLLQYVHCNCLFSSLCRHIFWNQPYLSNQIVFLPEQKIKTKFKYMSRTKRAFKMRQEAFSSFLKSFHLLKIVSNLVVLPQGYVFPWSQL